MDVFTTHKRISGLNAYRKSVVVVAVVAIVMGTSVGYGKELIAGSIPDTEIEALSGQIKQLVKGLEYSDKVAEDFVKMVIGWKDARGRPILAVWKKRLAESKDSYEQGKISKTQLAGLEETIARKLTEKIKKEISYDEKFFDLPDVVKHRQAQCLSYSNLFYVLGNSVGLSVNVINVLELPIAGLLSGTRTHSSCIIGLRDGMMIMIDLARFPKPLISKRFHLSREFIKVGNYWELKDNPLGIHRKIQVLDRDGLIAALYTKRGDVYNDLGQYKQAISEYTKAIKLNPKDHEAYHNLGTAYQKLYEYSTAIANYTQAIGLNTKFAKAYSNRGAAHSDLHEYQQAISDFNTAIELDPKDPESYYNRGVTYHESGQITKAINDYSKAIELNTEHINAYFNRALAYTQLSPLDEAISDYTKAIILDPNSAEVYISRGNTYGKLRQFTEAISDYSIAIKLDPNSDVAYNNRGSLYSNMGRSIQVISGYTKATPYYKKAISDFNKAIELNPKHSVAFKNRGLTLAWLGKHEEAKDNLLKAIGLNPSLGPEVRQISEQFKLELDLD